MVVVAILRSSAEVSYITTAVASQLLSPLLWDHYAVILLLPVAWLLAQGHWWALGIMLVTSIPIILFLPSATYPVLFAIGLVAPMAVEAMDRRRAARAQTTPALGPT